MRVLIIDNKSAHLENLTDLIVEKLGEVNFTFADPREATAKDVAAADLVIISGGSGRSIVKNPLTFKRVIKLLEEHIKPTIGICLGAEAISATYGAKLKEMPVRRVGNIRINVSPEIAAYTHQTNVSVYQFHKWLITDLPPELLTLGTSKDGIEVLRHISLPFWGVQFHPEVRRRDNHGHIIFEYILDQLGLKRQNAHAIVGR